MSESSSSSSDEDSSVEECLENQIIERYEKGVFDTKARDFLPAGSLAELVTPESISREFNNSSASPTSHDDKPLIKFILNEAKKLFALTLVSGIGGGNLRAAMKRFKKDNFSNKSLPIAMEMDPALRLPCFPSKIWKTAAYRNFLENQWIFLASVFSKEKFKIDLEPEHIFPFVWVGNETKSGTFSDVFQVRIHEKHQKDPNYTFDGEIATVAIKKIKDTQTSNEAQELVNKEWEAEAKALNEISGLNHPNIIQRIAAVTRGRERYFMFQWADGGSLRDFWEENPHPKLTPSSVKEIVEQLCGLADALNELHHYDGGSYRHGDLKPENILRFRLTKDKTKVGLLKISDMGLAKHHAVATYLRPPTSTRYGTVRYEPPEIVTQKLSDSGRSRLYDCWSMGCITLELIVWLLYGYERLKDFNEGLKGQMQESSPYFEVKTKNGVQVADVHPSVRQCMEHISRDPECVGASVVGTAVNDLLDIVRTKLLVIPLPQHRESFQPPNGDESPQSNFAVTRADSDEVPVGLGGRATSQQFCNALRRMLEKGEGNDRYWSTGAKRDGIQGPRLVPSINAQDSFLSPIAAVRQKGLGPIPERKKENGSLGLPAQLAPGPPAQRQNLNKVWDFPIDNAFAQAVLKGSTKLKFFPQATRNASLCQECKGLDFFGATFKIRDVLAKLEERSRVCDFCKMRWDLSKHLNAKEFPYVHFSKLGSNLRMNEGYPPSMTICQSPDPNPAVSLGPIQIGLPELPTSGSDLHLAVIRSWVQDCDHHHKCQPCLTEENVPVILPTRLIDVGTKDDVALKLYETRPDDTMRYVALSHPWGPQPHFCTYPENIDEYKRTIDFSRLPATFQNAVTITRALGHRYIWIDSLCIIQGPNGDFNTQAKHMENVFSSAYCVLAASAAKSQVDGFLKERDAREYLTIEREGKPPFYICRFIDDFNQHVLEGSLNKRGWVLQERALAHRTMYFTSKQTYWECGEGVRCETLTKMKNKLASFIADPNFPKVAFESSRGERIHVYQDLYTQYSRLQFTRIWDRPIAIAGLEKRLIQAYNTLGGFGIFDDGHGLLRRSLLWQRGSDENKLDRITFPSDRQITVPSWSWMAYKGGIDYLDLPFGDVEWEEQEIRSPWNPKQSGVWHTGDQVGVKEMTAVARDFSIKSSTGEAKLVYDIPATTDITDRKVKCVVVGRRKEAGVSKLNQLHYVLLVAMRASQVARGGQVCERVGVGYMIGQWIELDSPGTPVKIR